MQWSGSIRPFDGVLTALVVLLAGLAGTPAYADGDPVKGKELYRVCVACHSLEPGKHRTGPSLHNIYGAKIGGQEGYRYSSGFRRYAETGPVWTTDNLYTFLKKPRELIRGTKMSFVGYQSTQERLDVIAYLRSISE